ncbi:hypothetical protein AK812_SmicGene10906 [Symbiodinium microadriaticum]|uniref:Uncharacterized protein n=1 Tax=Symbiodinium microadriaticum TaxID=2951 RepID=A0A1Q9EEN1_SYMMI|nr:hypothetical protein AK812_SmicGene10906 [Symbiodinium microadriaticum]
MEIAVWAVVRGLAELSPPPLLVFTSSMAAVRGARQPLRSGCDCYDHEEQKVRSLLIVDVRDVAKAHVAAASGKATGERFIVSPEVRLLPDEVAKVIRDSGAAGPGATEVRCSERLAHLGVSCRPVEVKDMVQDLLSMEQS